MVHCLLLLRLNEDIFQDILVDLLHDMIHVPSMTCGPGWVVLPVRFVDHVVDDSVDPHNPDVVVL